LKIKLKGHQFDITEVIDVESLNTLNALTEEDFQNAFSKMAEEMGTVHMHRRRLLQE
jgi:hypothetical protein